MEKQDKCPVCKNIIVGRRDKKFCSVECKNAYHSRLNKSTNKATTTIDKKLHRNRSVLLELLLRQKQLEINKEILEKKGFLFDYCTGVYFNSQNKLCRYVYDFMWFELSNKKVYVYKIK